MALRMTLRQKLQIRWPVFYGVMVIGAALVVMLLTMVFRVEKHGGSSGFDIFLVLLFAPAASPSLFVGHNLGLLSLISGSIVQVFVYAFLAAVRFRLRWTVIMAVLLLHLTVAYAMLSYAYALG